MLALVGGGGDCLLAWWGGTCWRPEGAASRVSPNRRDNRASSLRYCLRPDRDHFRPRRRGTYREPYTDVEEGGLPEHAQAEITGRPGRAEVALSLVLLVGAGLLIKSFARLLASDPGFDPQNVVTMEIGLPRLRYSDAEQVSRFYQQLLERLEAVPGVESATVTNSLPGLGQEWQTDIAIKGRPRAKTDDLINVDWGIISAGYFAAIRVPLAEGRAFTTERRETGGRLWR